MKRWYVGDVMTTNVVTVTPDLPYKAVADLLVQHGVSAVPVVGAGGLVLGVVSEGDLLAKLEYADRAPATRCPPDGCATAAGRRPVTLRRR